MIYLRITQVHPNEREIRYRRKMKRKVEKTTAAIWLVFLVFLGFCWGITPYCFAYAKAFRGYDAIGSEVLIPLLPFLLIPAFDAVCDAIIKRKGWDKK